MGLRTQIRISFRGNKPQGRVISLPTIPRTTGEGSHAQKRIFKGGINHEKARNQSRQPDAPAGEIPLGNRPCAGHLRQYHPNSHPTPPGHPRWKTLQKLWEACPAAARAQGKAVLLRQMPHGMVEQPPGAGSEESILHHRLRSLRKGV